MNAENITVNMAGGKLKLDPITVGGHVVTFELEVRGMMPLQGIMVIATSDTGGVSRAQMSLTPKHDQAEKEFLRDLKEHAWRVAEEAAGHGQNKRLLDKLFGQRT